MVVSEVQKGYEGEVSIMATSKEQEEFNSWASHRIAMRLLEQIAYASGEEKQVVLEKLIECLTPEMLRALDIAYTIHAV